MTAGAEAHSRPRAHEFARRCEAAYLRAALALATREGRAVNSHRSRLASTPHIA